MYNEIEDLREQMHAQGRVAGHLWYIIKKYEQKQADVDFAKGDIEFLNNHLIYLNKALDECTNDYDRDSYELQIRNSKNELEKAKNTLIKRVAEFEELGDFEELKRSYEIENEKLYELMRKYRELIKSNEYEQL